MIPASPCPTTSACRYLVALLPCSGRKGSDGEEVGWQFSTTTGSAVTDAHRMYWLSLLALLVMGCQSPAPPSPPDAENILAPSAPEARVSEQARVSSDTVITARVEAIGSLWLPHYTTSLHGDGTVTFVAASGKRIEYRVPPRDVAALASAFVEGGFFNLADRYIPPDSAWFSVHTTTVTLSVSLDSRWKQVASGEKAGPAVLDSLTQRFFRVSRVDSVVTATLDSLSQHMKPEGPKPFWEWPSVSEVPTVM